MWHFFRQLHLKRFAGVEQGSTVKAGKWIQSCQVHKRGSARHFSSATSPYKSALPGFVTEMQ